MSAHATLNATIEAALSGYSDSRLGVAVSGGGDSIALLRLLHDWGQAFNCEIYAASVNHNLRECSDEEAQYVAKVCKSLNIPHRILSWDDWDGQGNLQNAARNARKTLLAEWALDLDFPAIALGHTQDDQAETFLLRLARGSGVDGLSGMRMVSGDNPIWLRPLLQVSRSDLRDYLTGINQDWVDDPSNDNEIFDRVKMRKAMPILQELGLTKSRLAKTSESLQSSRAALEQATKSAAHACCEPSEYGTVTIDMDKLLCQPVDIQHRLLSHSLCWVSGASYRPRYTALKSTYELLQQGKSQTLAGCYIKVMSEKQIIVMRELASMVVEPLEKGRFDGRWRVVADSDLVDTEVKPLGENGLRQLKNWRDLNVLREILMQTPAAWQDDTVISAPFAGIHGPVQVVLVENLNQFYLDIVSH